tara:strand:+ start:8564 stop:11656 length:3093 start_codon:yes stop_codon:yes gene_type:complete
MYKTVGLLMKVEVKKSVLLNLVKMLHENRTNHNLNGNFIHKQSTDVVNRDPFGADDADYEDIVYDHMASFDIPIKPNSKMGRQVSIPRPPVEDPDFVPQTLEELSSSAICIAREVPDNQIEFFYRKLHELLDDALDNEEMKAFDSINEANESYNITNKTKVSDLNVVVEARKPIIRRKTRQPFGDDSVEKEFEEMGQHQHVPNNDAFKQGYKVGSKIADLDIMHTEGEMDDELFETEMQKISAYYKKYKSIPDFELGFNAGIENDTSSGLDIDVDTPVTLKFPDKDNNYEADTDYENKSVQEWMVQQGFTREQKGDPIFRTLVASHVAVQQISQTLEDETTAAMMLYFNTNGESQNYKEEYWTEFVKPTQHGLGLTHQSSLVPLRVKEIVATKSKNQLNRLARLLTGTRRIKKRVKKMLKYQYERSQPYKFLVNDAAATFDMEPKAMMDQLSSILAKDYAEFGRKIRFVGEEQVKYIDIAIKQAISMNFFDAIETFGRDNLRKAIAASGGNKLDVDQVKGMRMPWDLNPKSFLNEKTLLKYLVPEIFEIFRNAVYSSLREKFEQGDEFILRDQGREISFSSESFNTHFAGYFDTLKDKVEDRHRPPEPIDIDDDDTKADLASDASLVKSKKGRKLNKKDYKAFMRLFGHGTESSVRQWFLKYPDRKSQLLTMFDDDTGVSPFLALQDEMFESMIDPVLDIIEGQLLPKYESIVNSGRTSPDTKGKKGNITKVSSDMSLDLLQQSIDGLRNLSEELGDRSVSDVAMDESSEALGTVGGAVIRIVVGNITHKLFQKMDLDFLEIIGDNLQYHAERKKEVIKDAISKLGDGNPKKASNFKRALAQIDVSEAKSKWNANYFTGLMDTADFKKMNQAAKALMKSGVFSQKEYDELQAESTKKLNSLTMKWFITKKINVGKKKGTGRSIERKDGKYKKLAKSEMMKLISNEAKIATAIEKALVEFVEDQRLEDLHGEEYDNIESVKDRKLLKLKAALAKMTKKQIMGMSAGQKEAIEELGIDMGDDFDEEEESGEE